MNNDPITDLLTWVQSGANLNAVSAIAVLTGVIRYWGVPAVKKIALTYAKIDLSGKALLTVVYAVATGIIYGVSQYTHQNLPLHAVLGTAWVVANGAVGLHAAGKTMQGGTSGTNTQSR